MYPKRGRTGTAEHKTMEGQCHQVSCVHPRDAMFKGCNHFRRNTATVTFCLAEFWIMPLFTSSYDASKRHHTVYGPCLWCHVRPKKDYPRISLVSLNHARNSIHSEVTCLWHDPGMKHRIFCFVLIAPSIKYLEWRIRDHVWRGSV